jgi:hypothetical protein
MNDRRPAGLFDYLPILALFCYWLYGCVVCALISGDPRLLRISFVSAPVALAMLVSALKLARRAP